MDNNITTVFFVSEKNRYSYSPLLIIAEQFSSIQIHYISSGVFRLLDEDAIRKQIQKTVQTVAIKSNQVYIALFSFNSWHRKHFCILSQEINLSIPAMLRIAGGPDPTGAYEKLILFFDILCAGEGEFFLYQLYSRLLGIDDNKNSKQQKFKVFPLTLYNALSQYDCIEFNGNKIQKNFYSNNVIKYGNKLINKNYEANELKQYFRFIKNWYSHYVPTLKNHIDSLTDKILCPEDSFSIFPIFPMHILFFHPIELIRGCSVGCFFCQTSYMYGKNLRFKDFDIVKEAIKFQLHYKKKHIRFISPDFLSYYADENKTNLEIFKSLYNAANSEDSSCCIYMGSFPSELNPMLLDETVLKTLNHYAANRNITIGLQTFSKKLQIVSNRKTDVNKVYEILSYSPKYFTVILDIIFGLPGETDDDRELTIDSLYRILNENVKANIHFFLPLPGTPFCNKKPETVNKTHMKKIVELFSKGLAKGNFMQQYNEYMLRLSLPNANCDIIKR